MPKHNPKTCPVCKQFVNTEAYKRGTERAKAMVPTAPPGK